MKFQTLIKKNRALMAMFLGLIAISAGIYATADTTFYVMRYLAYGAVGLIFALLIVFIPVEKLPSP